MSTLEPRAMGQDRVRRDGPDKVRGTAVFAYETPVEGALFCHPLQATIARGRVRSIDTSVAEALPGVVAVLTPMNAERLASTEDAELAILQDDAVHFRGQLIGAVVAESSEAAREASDLLAVSYDEEPHDVRLSADRDDLYKPEKVNPAFPTDSDVGDVDAALAAAPVTVDRTYTTPWLNNNPLEPHSSTALWNEGRLTLWDSTQGVHPARSTVCDVFGIDEEHARVICPYVGGGFGSKGAPKANVILAVLAARAVPGRPVRLALTRQQMFSLAGYRTPTIQRLRLGADREGHLQALAMDVVEQTATIKEFAEQTALAARTMYASPNRRTTHRLARLDVPVPSWFRAPGECPGMFGPEVAMDELAYELGIDPVEIRLRNDTDVDPDSGKPFSSRGLAACLHEGAERFGWADRDPTPRAREEGGHLVGTGVASSIYPVYRQATSTAVIRFDGGRYVGRIGAADLGTGAWTVLPQILADALDVDDSQVDVLIGDTAHPTASVAGGSSGTSTWGSALVEAARAFREKFGDDPSDGDEASGDVGPNPETEHYAMFAFGAQFAEVRVDVDTGEIRLPRLLGVFAAGRIVNPRTARSQFLGGMTMGMSMALFENSLLDPRTGHVVNHDLAEYHIATTSDAASGIEAHWIAEDDPHVNAMGTKGIGEIGIVGTAAAVANAAFHATGVRVRDLPVTLDKLLV